METLLSLVIGFLFAAAVYLMLRRSLFKIALGLVLLSHATHLLILTAAGLTRWQAPIVASGATELATDAADPLPQALILTAIVIGFGVLSFALVLFHRVYQTIGSDDPDHVRASEE